MGVITTRAARLAARWGVVLSLRRSRALAALSMALGPVLSLISAAIHRPSARSMTASASKPVLSR